MQSLKGDKTAVLAVSLWSAEAGEFGEFLQEKCTCSSNHKLGSFSNIASGLPKRTGSLQFKCKGPRRAYIFPPQLSKFPRFGRLEREN